MNRKKMKVEEFSLLDPATVTDLKEEQQTDASATNPADQEEAPIKPVKAEDQDEAPDTKLEATASSILGDGAEDLGFDDLFKDAVI
jgi:hypothetical protein